MVSYYFLGYEEFTTEDGNSIIKICILDMKNKLVHKIYKSYSKQIIEKLDTLKLFDNVTDLIGFVIKRNGSISLDIK